MPIEEIGLGATPTYYLQDELGSTRGVTDSSGTLVATFSYDAYGQVTTPGETNASGFLFAGQYTDSTTGFQYLRARYYDPGTAQFLSVDRLAAVTGQPYSYANDSPSVLSDPSGLCSLGPVHIGIWGSGSCLHWHWPPDYLTIQGGVNSPYFVGLQGGVTLTKDGRVFFNLGPSLGSPGYSGYAGAGWINAASTTSCQVDSYVSGWSLSAGATSPFPILTPIGPVHGGAVAVWGNAPQPFSNWGSVAQNAFGYEGFLGNKQAGVSYTCAWNPWGWRLPVQW